MIHIYFKYIKRLKTYKWVLAQKGKRCMKKPLKMFDIYEDALDMAKKSGMPYIEHDYKGKVITPKG